MPNAPTWPPPAPGSPGCGCARSRSRPSAANAVSDAYLAATLHARATALVDDPETPLFFGRIDLDPGPRGGTAAGRPWYIGRRHVHDEHGDPVVVDWRADVSRPFYRATRTEPMGVVLRRRYGYDRGALTAYEDEHLTDDRERDRRSAILAEKIERPRTEPMRDIVATIQPEQDVIVHADIADTVCVQGAPGTGKTAVGLHRAAYLLYTHRDRLRRSGVLIVGPNRSFLSYIGQVLPALGELVSRVPVRAQDTVAAATLKGGARMATVLSRAVCSHLAEPTDGLGLPRGARRWRVPAYEIAAVVEELRIRGVRYGAGRALLSKRLAHHVLVQMERAGGSPDDRVQDAVARPAPVRALVQRIWPAVDPVRVVLRLLSDPDFLGASADGVPDAEEQGSIRWRQTPRRPASAPWSIADAVLVDEVADAVERIPSRGHVVLDEAQDLCPMQLRAVGQRCSTGSATVLGDIAQGTTPWATSSWETALAHLGKPTAHVEVLDRGYRVPAAVVEFAGRLLAHMAPGVAPPRPVREHPGHLAATAARDLPAGTVEACRSALRREGSIGVIAADARVDALGDALTAAGLSHAVLGRDDRGGSPRLAVVPASLCKGLEFDWVVVAEPAELVAAEPRGLRRLYVALTRAVSGLAVVHARPLPGELTA